MSMAHPRRFARCLTTRGLPTLFRARLLAGSVALVMAGASVLSGCGIFGGGGGGTSAAGDTTSDSDLSKTRPRGAVEYVASAAEARAAGRTDEALRLLALAIERNPEMTVAHVGLGELYRDMGEYAQAESSYRRAVSIEPRNFGAQYGHGVVLHLMDRLTDAVRAYLRALSIQPNDRDANMNLAMVYLQLDEPSQAMAYAQQAVEVDPACGACYANLGAVLLAMGQHASAVRAYESAAELMELTPELLLNLADAQGKLKRYQEMANTLRAAQRIEERAIVWERLGFALFHLHQYSDSIESFRASLRLDDQHYPALNGMGVILLNQYLLSDRTDRAAKNEAIRLLRKSLRIDGDQMKIVDLVARFSR